MYTGGCLPEQLQALVWLLTGPLTRSPLYVRVGRHPGLYRRRTFVLRETTDVFFSDKTVSVLSLSVQVWEHLQPHIFAFKAYSLQIVICDLVRDLWGW